MSEIGAADELVIEVSKGKAILIILGSLAFVAGGYWLFSMDAAGMRDMPIDDPLFVHGVGIAGIVFFGLTGIFGVKKLFDKRPGLVLNSAGIVDNSSAVAAGFVPWSEITGAEIYEYQRQTLFSSRRSVSGSKMLIIKVRNPEEFIQRGNLLKRLVVRMSYKRCGSPIAISPNTLQVNFQELLSRFTQYQQKYGQSMKASV